MVDGTDALPRLRADLGIFPGPTAGDGSPSITIQDRVRQKFFRLGWPEMEMLKRWPMGSAAAVVAAIGRETPLRIEPVDVAAFASFLRMNELVDAPGHAESSRLALLGASRGETLLQKAIGSYVYIRIPLIHGDGWIRALAPYFDWLFTPLPWALLTLMAVGGTWNVLRQWDSFVSTFDYLFNPQGAALFAIAIAISKLFHELGHAVTTSRAGCRIGTMGVALVVFWPVLYTDTTEIWKVASRRTRVQVALAGVAAESVLAVIALVAWSLLPDGAMRTTSVVFVSSIWVTTLLVNLNPLMRFDGYYLLSDLLEIPNLQPRSLAYIRWSLGEALLGFGQPEPEHLPPRTKLFFAVYGGLLLVYRLVLYTSIAVVVYHTFFKLAGILLFCVEMGIFVIRPVAFELAKWWNLRASVARRRSIGTGLLVTAIVAVGMAPWPSAVDVPAVRRPALEARLFPEQPGSVEEIGVRVGQSVTAGAMLVRLRSDDLDYSITKLRQKLQSSQWTVDHLVAYVQDRDRMPVEMERRDSLASELASALGLRNRLTITAPFAGVVVDVDEGLSVGQSYRPSQWLLTLADTRSCILQAYVPEGEVRRLHVGATGHYYREGADEAPVAARITRIDPLASAVIAEIPLSSKYGGDIPVREDGQGKLLPVDAVYRVELATSDCDRAPFVSRGHVVIDAIKESLFAPLWRRVLAALHGEVSL